jgi:hypothetical protein
MRVHPGPLPPAPLTSSPTGPPDRAAWTQRLAPLGRGGAASTLLARPPSGEIPAPRRPPRHPSSSFRLTTFSFAPYRRPIRIVYPPRQGGDVENIWFVGPCGYESESESASERRDREGPLCRLHSAGLFALWRVDAGHHRPFIHIQPTAVLIDYLHLGPPVLGCRLVGGPSNPQSFPSVLPLKWSDSSWCLWTAGSGFTSGSQHHT